MENEVMYIKLDDIIPNRFQPREIFDEEALNKLADSIRQHGVIEPILVRPVSNKYEIVAGERRYKASVLAGLTKIPAIVRQLDDKESSIVAFIENEHRSDVSAIEEARTMDRILKSNNMTQEELAKELGVNQSTVANKIRLLNLPLEVQESLMRNEISERHARSLLSVKNEDKQLELLKRIKERKMTVRELDSEIKEMNNMNENINIYETSQDYMANTPMNEMNSPVNQDYMNSLNSNMNQNVEQQSLESNNMSFLNNNPLPNESANMMPNNMEEPSNLGFMDYNNFNSNLAPETPPMVNQDYNSMNFEDNYSNNPLPNESANMVSNNMEEPSNLGFMDYNNFNSNLAPETPPMVNQDYNSMNFEDNYSNNPLPNEPANMVSNNMEEPTNFEFMDYTNNSMPETPINGESMSDIPQNNTQPQEDPGFMDFLKNYDNNNPLPEEPSTEIPPMVNQDNNPMNFEDNYSSNPLPNEPTNVMPNNMVEPSNLGFMDYTNNSMPETPINEEPMVNPMDNYNEPSVPTDMSSNEFDLPKNQFQASAYENADYSEPAPTSDNLVMNDVNPPVTTDFNNQYIENNPNFVDITKDNTINSVDEIINKLKVVVDDIKTTSKFKVDTDEINYDDIYQITIKIDKRDF